MASWLTGLVAAGKTETRHIVLQHPSSITSMHTLHVFFICGIQKFHRRVRRRTLERAKLGARIVFTVHVQAGEDLIHLIWVMRQRHEGLLVYNMFLGAA